MHLTLDLAGYARFGPDVEWVEAIDYRVVSERVEPVYAAVRAYWPGLEDGRLALGYAGVRPKLSGPGEPPADFRIDGPCAPWRRRPDQPVRHRVAGPDRLPRAGGFDGRLAGDASDG